MLGDADEGAGQIEALMDGTRDSPKSGDGAWMSLLAEAYLEAGRLDDAATALEEASASMRASGQLYPEPLRRLVRARWLHASGADGPAVRAALGDVRQLANDREAFLYTQRADDLERELFGHLSK